MLDISRAVNPSLAAISFQLCELGFNTEQIQAKSCSVLSHSGADTRAKSCSSAFGDSNTDASII